MGRDRRCPVTLFGRNFASCRRHIAMIGMAVSKKSIATASRFAGLLPEAALAGDVCVDTEGEVYFEWRVSASKYCSVTFAEDGCFLCLVKNGRNKTLTTTNVRSEALEYVRGIFS